MTHKQKVLRLLSDHKPHSHHELYQLGCVAHSRVSDLRKDGYVIEQWREGDLYLYRLGALNETAVMEPADSFSAAAPRSAAVSLSASSPVVSLETPNREGALTTQEPLFAGGRGAYGDEPA